MSETGTEWDAPNQQVVRADASAPWDEGTGGSVPPDGGAVPTREALEEMTKAQLLERAAAVGADVDPTWNKDEIRDAIGQAEGG